MNCSHLRALRCSTHAFLRGSWRELCKSGKSLQAAEGFRKRGEKNEACGAAGHIENKRFAMLDGTFSDIIFELWKLAVLGKLTSSFH